MSDASPNKAASVRQRLLNRAREEGVDFQQLLTRYTAERFLYRLSRSEHRDRFVLKGAMLFVLWEGHLHRITRDLDLLGFGAHEVEDLVAVVRTVCAVEVEDDGLTFLSETADGALIREDQEYEGVRVKVQARIGSARVQLQIDIAFGDAVTPAPVEAAFPTLLDAPAPVLPTYPKETVVAEKLQAMVALGIANSRMKDFYDVVYLARHTAFEGPLLTAAIEATFERRRTPVPEQTPLALTDAFAADATKAVQWKAFLRRTGLEQERDWGNMLADLRRFLLPPLQTLAKAETFDHRWTPGGPWAPR